ncbi:hypothetical protein [Pseudomonas silesiensis]|jgi:hypothetical protein
MTLILLSSLGCLANGTRHLPYTEPVGARLAREGITSLLLLHRGVPFAGKPRSYKSNNQ